MSNVDIVWHDEHVAEVLPNAEFDATLDGFLAGTHPNPAEVRQYFDDVRATGSYITADERRAARAKVAQ